VLSAHQMNLVEELCQRIILINRGEAVLYGALDEIKQRYAPHTVRVRASAPLGVIPGTRLVDRHNATSTLQLEGATPQDVLRTLVERSVPVEAFEVAAVPLEEIFIAAVTAAGKEAEHA